MLKIRNHHIEFDASIVLEVMNSEIATRVKNFKTQKKEKIEQMLSTILSFLFDVSFFLLFIFILLLSVLKCWPKRK